MKAGQIVKFHTPNQDEDPNQLYIVLEVNEDRVDIHHPRINTGASTGDIKLL